MENFHIVYALCRAAIANPSNAVLRQVERLRDTLKKQDDQANAKKLDALLKSIDTTCDMAPSQIQRSRSVLAGEELTPKTPIPVDKETSTPLAEIIFPEKLPETAPEFTENIDLAVKSILNEWNHLDKLTEVNAHPAKSCLIYGPPGTGKTHLALWMAHQMKIPIVLVRLDGLMSSFLGTTSRNIGNLFSFAAKYKCILLLDEFDAIAKLRNDPQEVGEIKRVVNTLLQNLDTRRELGFTIGITNHEILLDPAIWRRFDIQLEIPKPTIAVIETIINKQLLPLKLSQEEVRLLAWCVEGGTGADAKEMVQWLKKSLVIYKSNTVNLLNIVRNFALLNSGRINPDKRNLLAHGEEDIITALLEDSKYGFKQKEIASFSGLTQSAISKKISKFKGSEAEASHG